MIVKEGMDTCLVDLTGGDIEPKKSFAEYLARAIAENKVDVSDAYFKDCLWAWGHGYKAAIKQIEDAVKAGEVRIFAGGYEMKIFS